MFQLVIPIEQFQTSHVRILFKHRSANEGNAELIITNLSQGGDSQIYCMPIDLMQNDAIGFCFFVMFPKMLMVTLKNE